MVKPSSTKIYMHIANQQEKYFLAFLCNFGKQKITKIDYLNKVLSKCFKLQKSAFQMF